MSEYPHDSDSDGRDGSRHVASPLRSVISAVRHRWWLVLAVFLAVVLVSTWRTARQRRMYQATATIQVKNDERLIEGLGAQPYIDFRIDPIQSEMELIKSQEIGERVADSLGLRVLVQRPASLLRSELFGLIPPRVSPAVQYAQLTLRLDPQQYALLDGGKVLSTAPYGSAVSGGGVTLTVPRRPEINATEVALNVIPREAAGRAVRTSITTKGRPQTNIIEISHVGDDPALVQATTNAIAAEYRDFSVERQVQQSSSKVAAIVKALDSTKLRLDSAQDKLRNFKEVAKLGDVTAEQSALIESIKTFQDKREELVIERGVYDRLVGTLASNDTGTAQLRNLAGTGAIAANPYVSMLYGRWADQVKTRDSLLTVGNKTPIDRDVKWTDSLIAGTKHELRDAGTRYLESVDSRIRQYDARIDTLRREMTKYPGLEVQVSKLLADTKTLQQVYDALLSDYQRARISGSTQVSNVRLVDQAQRPTAPISPNRRQSFVTALILGLMLGTGAAILLETLDDSVKSPEEVRDELGLAVLGTIPAIKHPPSAGDPEARRLVTAFDSRSPVAEAYRSLRTNLAFARAQTSVRTILLTSPGPADGKSTTVANLAITFAQQGQRTLLIDGDLRRAVLDKMFEVPRAPGLTDVLVGKGRLVDVVHPTAIPKLSILGSGPFPPNPSELLGSAAMRDVLKQAHEAFDIVLLDSPPLLAVTDAAVLSTMVDAAILVVRVGSTARVAVQRAVGQLRAVHGRLVGAVMNDVNYRQSGYGGGYGYYYYYYYGHDQHKNGRGGVVGRVRRWTQALGSPAEPKE